MTDKAIIKRLFYQHYGEMTRLAQMLLYSDEEAEDVVQDIFLKLMETDTLPCEGKARAYLLTAVRNGCVNRIRRKSLAERVKNLYPIEAEAEWQNWEGRMEMVEAVSDFAESHLTEPQLSIFRLRFGQGLKLREIAQELDMNVKTVFKHLSQTIKYIQREIRH